MSSPSSSYPDASAPTGATSPSPNPPQRAGRGGRWVIITAVIAVVALGLGGLGGYLVSNAGSDSPDPGPTACGMAAELNNIVRLCDKVS